MLGVARGMLTTLRHVFARRVTIQYPEQQMEMPPWTRGRPRLIYELSDGELRCTACGACAIACPVDVIKIEAHPGPTRKKVLDRFDLDMGGCIECALCVEACPFRAIVMAPDFEMAAYDREKSLVFNMHELRIAGTPEVDGAMEYIQGVKRGLAAQAATGAAKPAAAQPARAPAAAAPTRPAPAAPAAKPAAPAAGGPPKAIPTRAPTPGGVASKAGGAAGPAKAIPRRAPTPGGVAARASGGGGAAPPSAPPAASEARPRPAQPSGPARQIPSRPPTPGGVAERAARQGGGG